MTRASRRPPLFRIYVCTNGHAAPSRFVRTFHPRRIAARLDRAAAAKHIPGQLLRTHKLRPVALDTR